MILSNLSIQRALDDGSLIIKPEPRPRSPEDGTQCPYATTAVDLRIGHEIVRPTHKQPTNVDLRNGGFARLKDWDKRLITEETPYSLAPNTFVLAKTIEHISLPISDSPDTPSLAARVEGKSSYARCGMLVHFTAPTIHAGFSGTITLEIMNLGPKTILLYPEMYVCQLIIEQVAGAPFQNESQFHGQSTPTG